MRSILILIMLALWFLVGCQAANDYRLAASDAVLSQQINQTSNDVAAATDALIRIVTFNQPIHPIAVLAGTITSLVVGVYLGRNKRKTLSKE